jgi:hypothetical protein
MTKGKGRRLHHIEIHEGEKGGLKVIHYFEPEEHYFRAGDFYKVLDHIARNMSVSQGGSPARGERKFLRVGLTSQIGKHDKQGVNQTVAESAH